MTKNNEVAVVYRGNTLPAVPWGGPERFVSPSTDIFETPDAYVLMIDLPGAAKGSIRVTAENGAMSVTANVDPLHKENATFLVRELRTPTYHRVFNLAEGIDRQSIDARYDDGVLTITLFKKEETKPRVIEIR